MGFLLELGNNGTIDGQGAPWWDKFEKGILNVTRPYLLEIMFSNQIQISNLTFTNSPSWHIHPVYSRFNLLPISNRICLVLNCMPLCANILVLYCSNITIQGITILAPVEVPNTDGINPDSCSQTRIEDCYIVSGDDCIAVKSGWDNYGIKFGMPMEHLVIRRLTCISPKSATVALGSEMSGGIRDVRVEDVTAINTESSIRIKTAVGRGAYVKDIFVRRMTLNTMKYVFWMTGAYGSHPSEGFDPKALPVIQNINYRDIVAKNVTHPGQLDGIANDPFKGICISNATITLTAKPKKVLWNCTDVEGITSNVTPKPCALLPEQQKPINCAFPEDKLAIEGVKLMTCSAASA